MLLLIYVILSSIGCSTSNIVEVALAAASRNYNPRKITLVSWTDVAPSETAAFLASYSGSVGTVDLGDSHPSLSCHQHVLFASDIQDYQRFLVMIKPDQVQPIRVIVVLLDENVDQFKLLTITKTSWESDVSDLVIMTRDSYDVNVKVTTYIPYTSEKCQDYRPVTYNASEIPEFFPEKFKNLYGCPLRVSLIEHAPFNIFNILNGILQIEGTEGKFVTLLSDILNSSLVPVFPADNSFGVLKHGVWTGTMGDLVYNRADISASSAILNLERFKAVQVTHAYKTLDLVWCLPKVSKNRAWARVLLPLVSRTTVLVCLTACVFLTVAAVFNKIAVRKCKVRNKFTVLYTCAVFLGQPVKFVCKCSLLNRLFAMWLWFCLVLRIVYQGELVRSLERAVQPHSVPTFREALQYVDEYGGADSVVTFYRNTSILKKFKVLKLEEVHPMLVNIANGKRFLLAVDLWSVLQSGARVAVVEQVVARAPVVVLARARWAGARALRAAVARCLEAGLYRKLLADYVARHLRAHHADYSAADLTYTALDWYHLSGCFFILIIAGIVCFIVFVVEILWFDFNRRSEENRAGHVLLTTNVNKKF